jgi:hypothetical protein
MPRRWLAVATSLCALAVAPSAALADTANGRVIGTLVHQAQNATNENKTEQTATSEASSEQVNVNAPVAVMSPGANDGDVHQSNQAETVALSQNNNETAQGNFQNQEASAAGGKDGGNHGPCGCGEATGYGQGPDHGSGGPTVGQSQTASNSNETAQNAESQAKTEQENINAPSSKPSSKGGDEVWGAGGACGCGKQGHHEHPHHGDHGAKGGEVHQSNQAETVAESQNNNDTAQGDFQNQEASAAGANRGPCGCGRATRYGRGPDHANGGPTTVDQSQTASNRNETTQNAQSRATSEQENVNKGLSGEGAPKETLTSGPSGDGCGCGVSGEKGANGGEVGQSNLAETLAASENHNQTAQRNFQAQEGAIT